MIEIEDDEEISMMLMHVSMRKMRKQLGIMIVLMETL